MMQATLHTHIRTAPKLHFEDFSEDYTLTMTQIMLFELSKFLGDSHVRTENESVWYCEAYEDGRGLVAPFTVHVTPDNQWVQCAESDANFIANACANDVWNKAFKAESLIIAVPVY